VYKLSFDFGVFEDLGVSECFVLFEDLGVSECFVLFEDLGVFEDIDCET